MHLRKTQRNGRGVPADGTIDDKGPDSRSRLRVQEHTVVGRSTVSRLTHAGLTLGLTLVLSGIFTGTAQAGSGAQPLFPGVSPRTDGTTVVYQTLAGPGSSDVVAANLADRLQFPIAIGDGAAVTPDIDAGIAVWVQDNLDNLDIRGRNVESGTSFLVAGGDGNEVLPAISGSHVAYVTGPKEIIPESTMTLQVVDLNDNSVKTLDAAPVGAGSGGFLRPAISGDRVVWVRLAQVGDHVVHWQLKAQLLSEASSTLIAEEDLDIGGPLGVVSSPAYDVVGDTLVYTADLSLYKVDLATGQKITISSIQDAGFKPAQSPTTDGHYVFWQDYRASGTVLDSVGSASGDDAAFRHHGVRPADRRRVPGGGGWWLQRRS